MITNYLNFELSKTPFAHPHTSRSGKALTADISRQCGSAKRLHFRTNMEKLLAERAARLAAVSFWRVRGRDFSEKVALLFSKTRLLDLNTAQCLAAIVQNTLQFSRANKVQAANSRQRRSPAGAVLVPQVCLSTGGILLFYRNLFEKKGKLLGYRTLTKISRCTAAFSESESKNKSHQRLSGSGICNLERY